MRILRIVWFAYRHRKCPGFTETKGPDYYAVYCRTHNDGMLY